MVTQKQNVTQIFGWKHKMKILKENTQPDGAPGHPPIELARCCSNSHCWKIAILTTDYLERVNIYLCTIVCFAQLVTPLSRWSELRAWPNTVTAVSISRTLKYLRKLSILCQSRSPSLPNWCQSGRPACPRWTPGAQGRGRSRSLAGWRSRRTSAWSARPPSPLSWSPLPPSACCNKRGIRQGDKIQKKLIHKIPVKQEYPALCSLHLVKMFQMIFAKHEVF